MIEEKSGFDCLPTDAQQGQQKHIVRSFDNDLQRLTSMLEEMSTMVGQALVGALKALDTGDQSIALKVIENDARIDQLENKIDNFAIQVLALRQPVALDLRAVVVALKIASHLERIADYAEHVARRQAALLDYQKFSYVQDLLELGDKVGDMLQDVMKAYEERNDTLAAQVWQRDDIVDDLYVTLMRQLQKFMEEKPGNIQPALHLMFMAKHVERMGDHVTNIAESIHYLVHGTMWTGPADEPETGTGNKDKLYKGAEQPE